MQNCPCGSGNDYAYCCGIFITGKEYPSSPEKLMRSRYTAYTQADMNYITRTMKSPASDNFNPKEAREWAQQVKWLKLDVIQATQNEEIGFVEFQAHYSLNHKRYVLHEISEFHLDKGQWYYITGKGPDQT